MMCTSDLWHLEKVVPEEASRARVTCTPQWEQSTAVLPTRGRGWICSLLLCAQMECRGARERHPNHKGQGCLQLSICPTGRHGIHRRERKAMITEELSSASHYWDQPSLAKGSAVTITK